MENFELCISVAKKSQNSHKNKEFEFFIKNSMLFVLDKVTKKTVYIIVDIESDNISLSLSLAKCLIAQKIKYKRKYYTFDELKSNFYNQARRKFTQNDEYKKRKSEEKENTTSINHILNFYANHETSKLNIAS